MRSHKSKSMQATYLIAFLAITLAFMMNLSLDGGNKNIMLASASKKTDILFLKGKFILKDKKGSIVISDEKKCHCPHYFRR